MQRSTNPPIANANRRLRGYARVSTEEQDTRSQTDALRKAGCCTIDEEHASGADRDRPVLTHLLQTIQAGETLVVVRLDRLARSLNHLMLILDHLKARGAHFRSLSDPIDTGSPQGMLSLQVLGAVSEFERRLASERTKAGIRSAHARGRMSGNPLLRARVSGAIQAVRAKNDAAYMNRLLADMSKWLPVVRRMRPQDSWTKVANVLNLTARRKWSRKTLRHAVKRLIHEGIAELELLEPAPRPTDDQLLSLVAGIKAAAPDRTLQQIATQLEEMKKMLPNGGKRWYPASVRSLLLQAERRGILPKVAA